MAAAPAPARKSVVQAGSENGGRSPKVRGGWSSIPNDYFDFLPARLDGLPYKIVGIILRNTWGSPDGHQDWARLEITELAEECAASAIGVRKALGQLEDELGLIQSRGDVGRSLEYRALVEKFRSAPKLEPKTLDRQEYKSRTPSAPVVVSLPRSIVERGELPVTYDAPESVRVSESISDDGLSVSIRLKATPDTPVSVLVPKLREALTPVFVHLGLGKVPDEKLLNDVAAELGPTPIEHFMGVVRNRVRRDRHSVQSGLFPKLAKEARDGYAAAVQVLSPSPKQEATAEKKNFKAEPEDSSSPWSRIRAELKRMVSETEYSNWLLQTAFSSHERAVLTIRVPQQVTADYIREIFTGQIRAAAVHLGIGVQRVEFIVEEGS